MSVFVVRGNRKRKFSRRLTFVNHFVIVYGYFAISKIKIFSMLYRIDAWLMPRFQKLTDFIQDWTGIDCFGVAHVFRVLYSLVVLLPVCLLAYLNHS